MDRTLVLALIPLAPEKDYVPSIFNDYLTKPISVLKCYFILPPPDIPKYPPVGNPKLYK